MIRERWINFQLPWLHPLVNGLNQLYKVRHKVQFALSGATDINNTSYETVLVGKLVKQGVVLSAELDLLADCWWSCRCCQQVRDCTRVLDVQNQGSGRRDSVRGE
jgi:hypothetical protein